MRLVRHIRLLALAGMATVGLSACATGPDDASSVGDIPDPFERVNRVTFGLNQLVDGAIVRPAAQVYRGVVPDLARQGVTNFLRNLRSPIIIANQALQADWQGVEDATARMLVNSTVGLAGVFDVADHNGEGIPFEGEDFGQTLAVWGVDHGAYIVLPLLGPSSVRDVGGLAVDYLADPVRLALEQHDAEWAGDIRPVLTVLSAREATIDATDELEASSIDYYAAVRSLYGQLRRAAVADGEPDNSFEFPDFDDAWLEDGDGEERTSLSEFGTQDLTNGQGALPSSTRPSPVPTLALDLRVGLDSVAEVPIDVTLDDPGLRSDQ